MAVRDNRKNTPPKAAKVKKRPQDSARLAKLTIQRRTLALLLVFGVVTFLALFAKAYDLTINQFDEMKERASGQQMKSTTISASRGSILDRNGTILAMSASADTVFLDPKAINDYAGDLDKKRAEKMVEGLKEGESLPISGQEYKDLLARKLAEKLGYLYVDTGAIYRTVALKVLWEKADPADPAQVIPLLEGLEIHMGYEDGVQKMYLEGEDVSGAIRRHKVSGAASQVSAIPEVRSFLLEFQRKLARESSVVMDGRDIGTVVLPDADVKIFLTAAPEARAKRRLLELEQRGEAADFDAILRDIKERDYQDEHRPIAPLKQAADAVLLDTTDLDLGQSMSRLLALVKEKIGP